MSYPASVFGQRSVLWIAVGLALCTTACAGSSLNDRPAGPAVGVAVEVPPPAPYLTPMPRVAEPPDQIFFYADQAFQAGDFPTAHRLFGNLFIQAPDFRGGVPAQALAQTCQRLGIDCTSSMARLEFMRDAWFGAFGPLPGWVPQQRADFDALVACWDHVMINDPETAMRAAQPRLAAPLDGFRATAGRCMQTAQVAMEALQRRQAADRALVVWNDQYPCMEQHADPLLDAARDQNWELVLAVTDVLQPCATTLQQIIDDGILEGDDRLGVQHDMAWSTLSEIAAVLEDNQAVLQATRDGQRTIVADQNHARLQQQYGQLTMSIQQTQQQLDELQRAAAMLNASSAAGLAPQIQALEAQLAGQQQQRMATQAEIDAVRASHGLGPVRMP